MQKCTVHQLRNSLKHIPWKEKKEFAKDLKGKQVFLSDESLSKSLYLAIIGIEKKWSGKKLKNWGTTYDQLKQIFEGRINYV